MATSSIEAVIPCDIHRVWETLLAVERYTWRTDLSKTEVRGDRQFVEYPREGIATVFTVTLVDPCRRWEFDLDNCNIKGHWIGILTPTDRGTEITFIEHVTAKKFWMRPFVKRFLKRQQAQFVLDLKRVLCKDTARED